MSELKRHLESWMGIQPVAPGEDTAWELRWSTGWPDWVLVLFAVFAVFFVVGIYLRDGASVRRTMRLVLAGLRLAIVLALVVMIGELEILIDRTGLPYLVFLIDDSESMKVTDVPPLKPSPSARTGTGRAGTVDPVVEDATRLERVREWLVRDRAQLAELTEKHKIQVQAYSSTPRLLGTYIHAEEIDTLLADVGKLEPVGTESQHGRVLREVLNGLRGTPPSAIVMLTDGVTTRGEPLPQAAQYAYRKNIPVFTVGVGDPERPRDVELSDLLVDDTVFAGDLVQFEAKMTAKGFEGQDIPVILRQKGMTEPLDRRSFTIPEGESSVKVRLVHDRPTTAGTIQYILEVPLQEREIVTENNQIEREVQVIDEKIKVLLVDSYPRYEFRFLKNLLEREPSVDLTVVLLDADPEYVQQDRVAVGFFPTERNELAKYSVLILGDVPSSVFSQAQLADIRDFVENKAGGLLVVAGKSFVPRAFRETPLEDLLPIDLRSAAIESRSTEGYLPRLTVEGRLSPSFRFSGDDEENQRIWNLLPELFWHAPLYRPKPGAQVLLEHPNAAEDGIPLPLVVSQFFGSGRSYYQAFDSTWRWRFRVEDAYFARYWIQTIRYLSRSKLLGKSRTVELLVDRPKYRRGEPVQIRVRFRDEAVAPKGEEGVQVIVEREGLGERRTVELARVPGYRGVYEALFGETVDGRYTVRLGSPLSEGSSSALFTVVPPPGEMDRVQMNEEELKLVAKRTGGRFQILENARSLWENLPSGRPVALQTDPAFPLWRSPPMLFLFVGLLLVEWVLRKRARML